MTFCAKYWVIGSEFNLDIFFTCWSHFFLNSPYVLGKWLKNMMVGGHSFHCESI